MIVNKLRFLILAGFKFICQFLYTSKLIWIGPKPDKWNEISLILILNHTSLFEFVYAVALPFSFLNELSKRLVIPVADKTMKKPIAGTIFKFLTPHTITLTRKRDESWQKFLDEIDEDKICIFMPEGQMKRKTGLDKFGNPMQMKKGVYYLMQKFKGKKMAIVYSHGLHHVLAPEDSFPKIFKKITADIESLDVDSYLSEFNEKENPAQAVAEDLQERRDKYCFTEP